MLMRRKADHTASAVSDSPNEAIVNVPGAATGAPAAGAAWDPYEVWLTRVKQPRERSAPTAAKLAGRTATTDVGTAARNSLSPALSR